MTRNDEQPDPSTGSVANGWIPVSERLPVTGFRVLVWDKEFREVEIGTYCTFDGWVGDEIAMLNPSHWMPLPAPPTEGK
jgi:hypothetical protein